MGERELIVGTYVHTYKHTAGYQKIQTFSYTEIVHTRPIPDYPYDPYTIRLIWSGRYRTGIEYI